MTEYDGSVVIKTKLDVSGLEKESKELKASIAAAIRGAKELASVAKQSAAAQLDMLKRTNAGWREQLSILEKIKEIMGGAAIVVPATQKPAQGTEPKPAQTAQAETAEYAALRKELEAIGRQLDANAQKQQKMIDLAGGVMNVSGKRSYLSLQYDAEMLRDRYDEIQEKMREMEDAGKRYAAAPALEQQSKAVSTLTTKYTRLATVTREAQTEAVKTTTSVTKHGALSLKNITKYAFGIRSAFFLMRRLRAVAKESLGLIASFDSTFNSAVSELLTKVKQLKADFGTMLQPLLQAAAPVFNYILDKVSQLVIGISKFFAAFTGQGYIDRATVKAIDYADSLDEVAKSANEAAKALGGYDKLNIISDSGSGSGEDAKNTLALTKDTVSYVKEALDPDSWTVKLGKRVREIFDSITKKLKSLKSWLEKQEWIQTLISELQETFSDPDAFLALIGATLVISAFAKMLGLSLSKTQLGISVVIAIIGYKIGNKIFDSFPDAMKDALADTVGEFAEAFGENGLKGILMQWVDNVIELLAELGGGIKKVWNIVVNWIADKVIAPVANWFKNLWKGIKETFSGIGTWFKNKFTSAYNGITGAWSGMKKWAGEKVSGIKETFSGIGTWFSNKFTAAWNGIKGAWSGTKKWFSDKWTGIKEAFASVGTWFSNKFTSAWTGIKNAWSGVKKWFSDKWADIKGVFGSVKTWFSDKFDGAWSAIKDAFKKPKKVFTDIWNEIKSPFEGVTTWFQVKFTNAWNKITEIFGLTKVKKFFKGVWEKVTETFTDVGTKVGEAVGGAFKKVINVVLETVETALNTPIKAINALLSVINQIPSINIGKLDTLSLPRLAQGAVIPPNKEFLAVLGDQKNGTNIEAPLDTIVKAMEIALGSNGGRQDININIDGKTVAKVVWSETEKRYKQTGTAFA